MTLDSKYIQCTFCILTPTLMQLEYEISWFWFKLGLEFQVGPLDKQALKPSSLRDNDDFFEIKECKHLMLEAWSTLKYQTKKLLNGRLRIQTWGGAKDEHFFAFIVHAN